MDYREWLKAGLSKPGKTIEGLAERLERHRSAVDKMLADPPQRKIKAEELPIIAEYIEEPVPMNGTSGPDIVVEASPSPMVSVRVEGVVEAGAFREAEMLGQVASRTIYVPRDRRCPFTQQRAFEVHGDSMNERGILDGHTVFGVDFVSSGASLSNGMIVVVERERDGLLERSLKEVRLHKDEIEFCPRSTNPVHESFRVPRRWAGQDFAPGFRILALVHRGTYEFDGYR